VYILRVFDCCVHFYRLGSENLPGETENVGPPATQPPDEDHHGKSGDDSDANDEGSVIKASNENEEGTVMEADIDAGVPPSKEPSQLSPPDSSKVSMGKDEGKGREDNVPVDDESKENEEGSVMEADIDAGVPPSKGTSQLSPADSSKVSMGKGEGEARTSFSQREEEEKMMESESDEEMRLGVAKGSSHQCMLTDTSGK
jgi:hypothetical protein